jgi:hypothetical protein
MGSVIYFIVTDASDKHLADMFTNITGFKVNFAPLLSKTPESARSQAYIFENGLQGDGLLGFQTTIANTNPEEKGYSPLYRLNLVKWENDDGENILVYWKDPSQARILQTVHDIAQNDDLLKYCLP